MCEFVCYSSDYHPQHVSSCVAHLITIHNHVSSCVAHLITIHSMWVRVLLNWLPSTTKWVCVLLNWLPSTACEFVCCSTDYHPQHVSSCVAHLITIHSMWVCVLLNWLPSTACEFVCYSSDYHPQHVSSRSEEPNSHAVDGNQMSNTQTHMLWMVISWATHKLTCCGW
jgi:hypothetical protein